MKKIFIYLIILLLILVIIYIAKNKNTISNMKYTEENINIEYPYFNNKYIDEYINNYLNNTITTYKYNNKSNKLFIDYDYTLKDNNIILDIYNYKTNNTIVNKEIKTININLNTNKIIKTNKSNKEKNKEYDIYTNKVIDKNKKLISLTFDDGPNHNTKRILEILNKYNVKATFFILGSNIENNIDIIKSLKDSNMEISSHGYSHKLLTRLKEENIKDELNKTKELLFKITNTYPNLTRPSYGSVNKKVKSIIDTPIITWSIDTLDWKYHNSKRISNTILNKVKDGDIILMHDIYSATANALDIVIPKLLEQNYQLVTVSELFYYKNIILEPNKIYTNAK